MWSKVCIGLHVKYLSFLSDFNETWIFFRRLSKNTQVPNLMKIHLVGEELSHTDRRTDRRRDTTKLIAAFRNFAKGSKNWLYFLAQSNGTYSNTFITSLLTVTLTLRRFVEAMFRDCSFHSSISLTGSWELTHEFSSSWGIILNDCGHETSFAVFWMLYALFWVIPRRLNFICRRFGTLYLFHLHSTHTALPMKMEQSVPKRRRIKFRRRGITQKEAYNKLSVVKSIGAPKGTGVGGWGSQATAPHPQEKFKKMLIL
jgi:hypothetical protein